MLIFILIYRETSSKNVKTDQSSNSTVKTPRSFTEVKQQSAQVKPPAPKRKFQETVEAKVEQLVKLIYT